MKLWEIEYKTKTILIRHFFLLNMLLVIWISNSIYIINGTLTLGMTAFFN